MARRVAAVTANGLIYAVLTKATVGPVVSDGIIVDCPPYVGRTRLGRDACALWREQARRGARPSVDPRPGWAAVA